MFACDGRSLVERRARTVTRRLQCTKIRQTGCSVTQGRRLCGRRAIANGVSGPSRQGDESSREDSPDAKGRDGWGGARHHLQLHVLCVAFHTPYHRAELFPAWRVLLPELPKVTRDTLVIGLVQVLVYGLVVGVAFLAAYNRLVPAS